MLGLALGLSVNVMVLFGLISVVAVGEGEFLTGDKGADAFVGVNVVLIVVGCLVMEGASVSISTVGVPELASPDTGDAPPDFVGCRVCSPINSVGREVVKLRSVGDAVFWFDDGI